MPTISVIIPAYNAEKTIKQTIESVLNQTFSDFELTIVNDGSTDSTLDIVNSIKDSRIQVFSHPNSGPNRTRNRGISQASGEYISFLDADDLWTSDKLEAQLKALQANPEAAVAYSWTNWIDEDGQYLHQGSYSRATGDVYLQLLLLDFIGSGSNPLICSQALAEVGGFDESLVAGQDWDMWLRLAARYQFVVVPSPKVLYRKSLNSWSSNFARREVGFRQVIEKALARSPESIQQLKRTIIANRYKCLVADTLEGVPGRERGLAAMRFLGTAIKNDPSLLKARVLAKVLFKIAVMIALPPQQAQDLLLKIGKLSDVNALHGYIQLEIS